MKKVFILLIIICTFIPNIGAQDIIKAPQKVFIVDQTLSKQLLQISVIDLSNNELVLLFYSAENCLIGKEIELKNVKRTGIIVDIEKQINRKR